jgi:ribosomal protein L4
LHEAVRAELNADRAATRGVKTRGLVSGGRSKPWRQKGTGRARARHDRRAAVREAAVSRSPPRTNFEVKVNRKARKAVTPLSAHPTTRRRDARILDGPRRRGLRRRRRGVV